MPAAKFANWKRLRRGRVPKVFDLQNFTLWGRNLNYDVVKRQRRVPCLHKKMLISIVVVALYAT